MLVSGWPQLCCLVLVGAPAGGWHPKSLGDGNVAHFEIKSVTAILPEELMDPSRLPAVISYLKAAPLDGDTKRGILAAWARNVGAKISASQRAAVIASGTDNQ
jgi:hypothetical protein